MVGLFQVGTSASAVAQSAATVRANPNAIPNLTLVSLNLNGRSYSPTSSSSSSSGSSSNSDTGGGAKATSSETASNVGMVVGIVVGVGVVVLVVVAIISVRIHKVVKNRHQPMIETPFDGELSEMNDSPRPATPVVEPPPPAPVEEEVIVTPVMENPETKVDRIDSAPIFSARSRSVSIDLDVIDCDNNPEDDDPPINRPFFDFKLIDFD